MAGAFVLEWGVEAEGVRMRLDAGADTWENKSLKDVDLHDLRRCLHLWALYVFY